MCREPDGLKGYYRRWFGFEELGYTEGGTIHLTDGYFTMALMKERPLIIRNPNAIRPWMHVLEPLAGYLNLAERLSERGPEFSEAWNFGSDDGGIRAVSWIAEHLTKLWGNNVGWHLDSAQHPPEAAWLRLDCSKARRLGWSPRLPLSTALEWTVDWYRGYQRGEDMCSLTEAQIADYEDLPE